MKSLVDRIEQSVGKGALIPVQPVCRVPLDSLYYRDLLRPYEDVFGLPARPEAFRSPRITWRPQFRPEPKRTLRALPLPRTGLPAPLKEDFLPLWKCLRGIMDYYAEEGIALPALDRPLTSTEAVGEFFTPLSDILSGYWPLDGWFECHISEVNHVLEMPYIPLYFPFYHYDEEGSYSKVAFLEGMSSVAGMLGEVFDNCEDIPEGLDPRDLALIEQVDWMELVKTYAESQLEKKCDLRGLENFGETFFGELMKRYPFYPEKIDPTIAGTDCTEIPIESSAHIRFAIDYAEAWYEMDAANPGGYQFETNGDQEATRFIRELLRVYRMEKGLERIEYPPEELQGGTGSACDWNDFEEDDYEDAA